MNMKYLVKAKLRAGKRGALIQAISDDLLGIGSVAFGEYIKNIKQAREMADGTLCWVEVCFCATPLQEERPYWEEFVELLEIEHAVDSKECQDANGDERRACLQCVCTQGLEDEMLSWGKSFLTP